MSEIRDLDQRPVLGHHPDKMTLRRIAAMAWLLLSASASPGHAAPIFFSSHRSVADGLAQAALPFPLFKTGASAPVGTIADVLFCRAVDSNTAEAIALAQPSGSLPLQVLLPGDCASTIAEVAKRISSKLTNTVLRLRIVWAPWKVTISVVDAAGSVAVGQTDLLTAAVKQTFIGPQAPTQLLDTSKVLVPINNTTSLRYRLALQFAADSVLIFLVPETEAASWSPPQTTPALSFSDRGGKNRVAIAVPYTEANRVLAILSAAGNILRFRAAGDDVVVRDVRLEGETGKLRVIGYASQRSLKAELRCNLAGDDLAITEIKVSPILDSCPSGFDGLECNAKNGLARAAAGPLSDSLTDSNRNMKLRPATVDPAIIQLNGKPVSIKADVLLTRSTQESLWLVGVVSITR